MTPKERKQGGTVGTKRITRRGAPPSGREWNFDKPHSPDDTTCVSDEELVACCCWEYARESASIRAAVETAKTAFANERIPKRASEEREAFRAAADRAFGLLLRTGFDISFWAGLPFPKPWQSVDRAERKKWENARQEIPTPVKFPPFQVTGDSCIAGQLYAEAKKVHEARQAPNWRLSQIDSGVANLEEAAELRKQLSEQGTNPIPVALRGIGGVDYFIAQINWRDFTNKQIVESFKEWVNAKQTRPANPKTEELVGRRNDRGRDLGEWRAKLERLGIMRLLRQRPKYYYRLNQPRIWGRFKRTDWSRSLRMARYDFHELFPFLPSDEEPLSWPTAAAQR